MLVEVGRKSYLASIVPVIMNAILNEHQIVIDIIAFVKKGDFPRSRLGEKQRGKILASWVTRKMQTMAQFGIRDPEPRLSDVNEVHEPRSRVLSIAKESNRVSSLRDTESVTPNIERGIGQQTLSNGPKFSPLPVGISEMPSQNYDNEIRSQTPGTCTSTRSDETPTNIHSLHIDDKTDELNPVEGFDFGLTYELPGSEVKNTVKGSLSYKEVEARFFLPAVEGREQWTNLSQQPAFNDNDDQDVPKDEDDNSWKNDAIMHMNLADQ